MDELPIFQSRNLLHVYRRTFNFELQAHNRMTYQGEAREGGGGGDK